MDKKLYFFIKSHFRERQWDTYFRGRELADVIAPANQAPVGSITSTKAAVSLKGRLKNEILLRVPLLNRKKLPKEAEQADLVYTWGYLPDAPDKALVIEMDNPYCVTYYNARAFKWYKPILKKYFIHASKLVFMSEASKALFRHEMGSGFDRKLHTLYPYAARMYSPKSQSKVINFLFIGLHFHAKGGAELLEGFQRVRDKNIRLTVISNTPDEIIQKCAEDKRIRFMGPIPRDKLYSRVYPQMDVFIFPSLYESFGMVLLEALSFGLGLISTDVFATPEMVTQGNGHLIAHPFLKREKLGGTRLVCPVRTHYKRFSKKYINGVYYDELADGIEAGIRRAVESRKQWREQSIALFEEKFSPGVWQNNFKQILSACL